LPFEDGVKVMEKEKKMEIKLWKRKRSWRR
jgi:hypothetical protein